LQRLQLQSACFYKQRSPLDNRVALSMALFQLLVSRDRGLQVSFFAIERGSYPWIANGLPLSMAFLQRVLSPRFAVLEKRQFVIEHGQGQVCGPVHASDASVKFIRDFAAHIMLH
jgi:hypothetical protein